MTLGKMTTLAGHPSEGRDGAQEARWANSALEAPQLRLARPEERSLRGEKPRRLLVASGANTGRLSSSRRGMLEFPTPLALRKKMNLVCRVESVPASGPLATALKSVAASVAFVVALGRVEGLACCLDSRQELLEFPDERVQAKTLAFVSCVVGWRPFVADER